MALVVYSNCGEEIIITTTKQEKKMIKEYFASGTGRDLGDYNREEIQKYSSSAVVINSYVKMEY